MAGTIIEQLTTKLGLDVTDFKKGIGEAKKSMDDLKGSGESAGNSIGGMIGAGAKRAGGGLGALGSMLGKGGAVGVGIGAAIYLGKKLDDTLFKVALSVRQVSIESKNLNKSSADLRNLQNASAMAGGSIEDAAQTVGDLQKSLFNLRFNGQVSEQIVMLSRLGVQFQDSYGRAREFNDVMLDTADALEKAQKRGEMNRGEASEFAEQAGFTGGMKQIVLSGRSGAEAELAKQRARTQINSGMTQGAERWVRGSLSLAQATEAEAGNKAIGLVGGSRGAADEKLEGAGTAVLDGVGRAVDFLGDSADKAGEKLINLAIKAGLLAPIPGDAKYGGPGPTASGEAAWAPTIAAAEKKYGIPTGILHGLIAQESNFDPSAVNERTGAKGLGQFMPKTAAEMGITAGQDPAADVDATARYLLKLRNQASSSGFAGGDVMPWVVATSAYHDGMKNVRNGTEIGPESLSYPGKVLRDTDYADAASNWTRNRPGGTGGHTEIQIDNIHVNTQATDAEGIAGAIGPAMQRKIMTAQAEGGIQ